MNKVIFSLIIIFLLGGCGKLEPKSNHFKDLTVQNFSEKPVSLFNEYEITFNNKEGESITLLAQNSDYLSIKKHKSQKWDVTFGKNLKIIELKMHYGGKLIRID